MPIHPGSRLRHRLHHEAGRAVTASVDDVRIVLQPIVEVGDGTIVAAEALARFPNDPHAPVQAAFAIAHAAGRGVELEVACLQAALARREQLPSGVLLCVNLSPHALRHGAVGHVLRGDLVGVVIEITEQAAGNLEDLRDCLAGLRQRGALIAIDDASTGYAGLLRLTTLRPDIVKLDRALVTGAADHVEQSAVIEALVSLSGRIGARVLGEGVETLDDLSTLAALDVDYAQGWAIAPPLLTLPAVAPEAVTACHAARAGLLRAPAPTTAFASNTTDPALTAISAVTAVLAGSVAPAGLSAALRRAAISLDIDVIGLSTLGPGSLLREITAIGAARDDDAYPLADFPATEQALATGAMIEAHVSDPGTDAAERALLTRQGHASLLLTPITAAGTPLGILEFRHRTHRRWTSRDMTQARILAEHLAHVLPRIHQTQTQTPHAHRQP